MASDDDTKARWRKLLLPGAASLIGAGAGLALTRTEKLRDALPKPGGVGDLVDDLRAKVSSVATKANSVASEHLPSASSSRTLSPDQLKARRARREQRRKQRAGR
jgi:hypothetical protein